MGYKILNALIRAHTDVLHLDTKISPYPMADKLSMKSSELVSQLQELHQREIVDFKVAGSDLFIRFLQDRSTYVFKEKMKSIQHRLALKRDQLKNVLAYVLNKTQCRSAFLAAYFEEESIEDCGVCDICQQKSFALNDDEIMQAILDLLQSQCLTKMEMQNHFPVPVEKHIDKLLDNKQIQFDNDRKYCKVQ